MIALHVSELFCTQVICHGIRLHKKNPELFCFPALPQEVKLQSTPLQYALNKCELHGTLCKNTVLSCEGFHLSSNGQTGQVRKHSLILKIE